MTESRHPIELLHPRSLKLLSGRLQILIRQRLWLQVLVAMLFGIGTGILLGPSVGWVRPELATTIGSWLALPGQVFLGLIQMIVVPLVVASIILGLAAGEDLEQLRRTGLRTVVFFAVSTTVAIVIGIGLALLVQPGRFVDPAVARQSFGAATPAAAVPPEHRSLPETLVDALPINPLGAMVEH